MMRNDVWKLKFQEISLKKYLNTRFKYIFEQKLIRLSIFIQAIPPHVIKNFFEIAGTHIRKTLDY